MAVVVTAAHAGAYIRTFTVTGALADNGIDSAPTNHGLAQAPIAVNIVDTTAAGSTEGDCWSVHTVGATQFTVRKAVATTQDRTALVTLYDPHSIDR